MADSASSATAASRPASTKSRSSDRRQRRSDEDETTPLLPESDRTRTQNEESAHPQSRAASSLLRSIQTLTTPKKGGRKRWPSLLALFLLCVAVVLIIVLGFMTPEIMEEYAKEAVVFEPTSISIPSFTSSGVQSRIQGNFKLDGSRVKRKSVRDLGRFGTWIAREIETGETEAEVYLPEHGNVVLGTAKVPPIKVSIRDGRVTPVDFLADLTPGPPDGIRQLADEWMRGQLGQLRLRGKAQVSLRSGILSIPKQTIMHTVLIDGMRVCSSF